MRPNFALMLSFEGVGLLHRMAAGWHLVGEVKLDSATLSDDLAELAGKARALDPTGLRSKLVIPEEQIKYLGFDTDATDGDEIERAVRGALDGATPYRLDELSYDWSMRNGHVHVAAVARETLVEAEDFALEHDFNPLCFVAMPGEDAFAGEPYFGETDHARKVLGPDETIARENEVIRIIGAAQLPEPAPVPDAEASAPVSEPAPESAPPPPSESDSAAAAVAPEAQALPPAQQESRPKGRKGRQKKQDKGRGAGRSKSQGPAEVPAQEQDDAPAEEGDATAPVAFTSIRAAGRKGGATSAQPGDDSRLPKLPEARFTSPPVMAGKPPAAPEIADVAGITAGEVASDKPAARHRAEPPPTPPAGIDRAVVEETGPERSRAGGAIAALFSFGRKGNKGEAAKPADKAPGVYDEAGQPTERAAAPPPFTVDKARDERERLTIFGARGNAVAEPERPRYLTLVLMAALLLVLVGLAAWAALFLDGGLSRVFGPSEDVRVVEETEQPAPAETAGAPDGATADSGAEETADTATATAEQEDGPAPEAPAPDDPAPEDTAGAIAEEESAESAAVAALIDEGTQAQVPETPDDAAAEDDTPQEIPRPEIIPETLTPDEARRRYAATGIWQKTPEPSAAPETTERREVYRTAPDPSVEFAPRPEMRDAESLRYAAHPPRPGTPPPPLTRYEIDERGFIAATPEGTETPDGIMIHSGSPPVAPPYMPPRAAPIVVEDPTDAAPADPALRPRARPEDLTGLAEPGEPDGQEPRTELAAGAEQGAEAVETSFAGAAEEAVAVSLKPHERPEGFAAIVANIRAADTDPVSADQRMSATEPTAASVARAATEENRISLREINLIGVYGKPDNRRALVRLASGRYRKVQVGDEIDGGQVAAIGDDLLRYVKRGRAVLLKMPEG